MALELRQTIATLLDVVLPAKLSAVAAAARNKEALDRYRAAVRRENAAFEVATYHVRASAPHDVYAKAMEAHQAAAAQEQQAYRELAETVKTAEYEAIVRQEHALVHRVAELAVELAAESGVESGVGR